MGLKPQAHGSCISTTRHSLLITETEKHLGAGMQRRKLRFSSAQWLEQKERLLAKEPGWRAEVACEGPAAGTGHGGPSAGACLTLCASQQWRGPPEGVPGIPLQASTVTAAQGTPCGWISLHLPNAEHRGSCLRLPGAHDSLFGSELLWLPGSPPGYK